MRQLLTVLLLAAPAFANGTLEVRGDRPGVVALTHHTVTGKLRDQLLEVTVEQVFVSHGTRRVEGVYLFPLPTAASVSAFEMTVDGKTMHGEVVEREKARSIYENIVRRKRDPALLEKLDHETFRARVFPIDPGKEVTIRLTYQQLLDDHDGLLELRYPLAQERLGAADVARIDLRFEVESSIDLVGVASPSHELAIETEGKRHAWLTLRGGADAQAKDLLVHVRRDPEAIGFTLIGDADSRTFLAILSPPTRIPDEAIPSRDLVYVMDTSGSMEGEKLAQAKTALKRGIGLLRERDRFRVLAFASAVRAFRDGWLPATAENKEAALAWIDGLAATGGTAIDDALAEALKAGDPARLGLVVFLTDGLPTVGEQNDEKIVANVKARNTASMRVFCFGVGFDQGVSFLDGIALETRASREYVTQGQDLEATLVRFFDRVQQPALADLAMEWGIPVNDVYPHPLPDLFAGDRLVVAGRYEKAGPSAVKLRGTRLGEPVEFVYEGTLPERGGVSGVARLWAQRKVDFLLREIGRNGPQQELKDEIVALGTRHHIVTPYTAGLVVEDEAAESGGTIMRPSDAPSDQSEPDSDAAFVDTWGDDEVAEEPFEGPSTNAAIGLGGGRGGYALRARSSRVGPPIPVSVMAHLRWIESQQSADSGAIGGVEETAFALLAMLGAGYTDRGSSRRDPQAKCVRLGLRHLLASQDERGAFANPAGTWLRTRAIATLAVTEAYGLTRNPRYKAPAQLALNLLAETRTPGAGWGDGTRIGEDDVLATVWAVLALRSGSRAGLDVDPEAFDGARSLLARRAGSLPPLERAAALLARIVLGEDPRASAELQAIADAILMRRPAWRDGEDPPVELWHFGTLAMFQVGGAHWKQWNAAMLDAIVNRQRGHDAGDLEGTWPVGATPRIAEQAQLAMCLETYYRYDRVFGVR